MFCLLFIFVTFVARALDRQALAEKYKAECSSRRRDGNCTTDGDTNGDGTAASASAAATAPLFPAGEALSLLDAHASTVADDRDRAAFWTTAGDLAKLLFQVRARVAYSTCEFVLRMRLSGGADTLEMLLPETGRSCTGRVVAMLHRRRLDHGAVVSVAVIHKCREEEIMLLCCCWSHTILQLVSPT